MQRTLLGEIRGFFFYFFFVDSSVLINKVCNFFMCAFETRRTECALYLCYSVCSVTVCRAITTTKSGAVVDLPDNY